jgi:hypothetical protein
MKTLATKLFLFIVLITQGTLFSSSISENTIKAVLIKRIASFVSWPEPLENQCNLCILNDEKFALEVSKIYKNQKIKGLNVNIISFNNGVSNPKSEKELSSCNITYIRKSSFKTPQLISFYKKPVLVISENSEDIQEGASLTLILNKRKISISLNEDVFESSGLKPSYQLLKMVQK